MVAVSPLPHKAVQALDSLPLVAILRGIHPDEVLAVADELMAAGFRMIEVPLNSPDAFISIAALVSHCPDSVLVGAGTVLTSADVGRLVETGARLMVTPNTNPAVIDVATRNGMVSVIGCLTPTEAFLALSRGASLLKVFPAGRLGPGYVRDIKAVLPAGVRVLAVGGIEVATMTEYSAAGYDGFGLGSSLYVPGRSAKEVGKQARAFAAAWRAVRT